MKLNEFLKNNQNDIETGVCMMKRIDKPETKKRLFDDIQFLVNEVKKAREAYNQLNNLGLISNSTHKKYDEAFKEYFLSVGKMLIEMQRVIESIQK